MVFQYLMLSPGTNITLYAHDILLSKPINDNHDFINLQVDINSLFQWTASRCLTFNPEKCKSMLVTRKRNPVDRPILTVGGCPIIAQVMQF